MSLQEIDAKAVYLSPLGRPCRWVPLGGAHGKWSWLYFEYVVPEGRSRALMGEGFTITRANVRFLRKTEVRHEHQR